MWGARPDLASPAVRVDETEGRRERTGKTCVVGRSLLGVRGPAAGGCEHGAESDTDLQLVRVQQKMSTQLVRVRLSRLPKVIPCRK